MRFLCGLALLLGGLGGPAKAFSKKITILAFGAWDSKKIEHSGEGQKEGYRVSSKNQSWEVAQEIKQGLSHRADLELNLCKISVNILEIEKEVSDCLFRAPDTHALLALGEYDSLGGELVVIETLAMNRVNTENACLYSDNVISSGGSLFAPFSLPMQVFACAGRDNFDLSKVRVGVDGGKGCCNAISYMCSIGPIFQKWKRAFGFIHVNSDEKAKDIAEFLIPGIIEIARIQQLPIYGWLGRGTKVKKFTRQGLVSEIEYQRSLLADSDQCLMKFFDGLEARVHVDKRFRKSLIKIRPSSKSSGR